MKRTDVSFKEAASRNGAGTAEAFPSARSYSVEAERALRAVSVAELDEQELCQLVSDMGQVKVLADRTVRRTDGHGTNIWSTEPRSRGPDPPSGDSGSGFG